MSFSTLPFLFYFLPAFLAVYYIVPARFRNAVLALGSLLFYWLSAGTGALLVLVALILVNFAAGRLIEDAHGDERRAWLILALACDVGSLFYFKYMGWFLENLGRLTNTDFSFFRVALPLGVSFYVFQSIAYVADVYRGDAEAERSLLDYTAFQAMFPQLVMGPILRLRDVSAELHTKRPFSRAAVESGFSLFVVGLGCKVVLADQLASLWTALERIGFAYLSAPLAWFGAVGYSLQLYYDFAGYSLMAMGLARMLGFVIPRNFDLPYCSRSISEFWRRWHITLGTWMRDYVFYPLSLSKSFGRLSRWARTHIRGTGGKIFATSLATFIVYLIIGIWHGANFRYIAFGLWNGVLITASLLLERTFLRWKAALHINDKSAAWRVFMTLRTMLLVFIGRYFTRSPRLSCVLRFLKTTVLHPQPSQLLDGTLLSFGLAKTDFLVIALGLAVLLTLECLQERGVQIRAALEKRPGFVQWLAVTALLLAVLLLGVFRAGYIPSGFIYTQF